MAISNDAASLIFKIQADGSHAESEVKRVANSIIKDAHATGDEALKGFGKIGSALSSLEGPAGLAAVAIAGIGAAVIGVSEHLFEMAKSSAEAVKPIASFSYLTGLGAEAVSSLRYQLNFMGKDLNDIKPGMIALEKQMDAAAGGSEKAQKALARLDIKQYTNMQAAMGSLFNASENFTNSVERGGALTAVVGRKQTDTFERLAHAVHGDFEGMIADAKRLGVTLSDEDVAAAKEFSHEYEKVMFQAKVATEKFALAYAGEISNAMEAVSGFLAANQQNFVAWGKAVGDVIQGVGFVFQALKFQANATFELMGGWMLNSQEKATAWSLAMHTAIQFVTFGLGDLAVLMHRLGIGADSNVVNGNATWSDPRAMATPKFTSAGGGKGGGGGGGKDDSAQKEIQDQVALQKFLLTELEDKYKKTMAAVREEFKKTGDAVAFITGANAANAEAAAGLPGLLDKLDALELQAQKKPTAAATELLKKQQAKRRSDIQGLGVEDVNKNNAEIEEAEKKHAEKVAKIWDDLKKLAEENDKEIYDNLVQNTKDQMNAEIEANQAIVNDETATYAERVAASNNITAIIQKNVAFLNQEADIRMEREMANLDAEKAARDKNISETIKGEEDLKAALEASNNEYARRIGLIKSANAATKKGNASLAPPVAVIAKPLTNLEKTLKSVKEIGKEAFGSLASGLGDMVSQWVLYGSAGEHALRKMTASVLASAAAQAAVQAIMEVAWGFSALARYDLLSAHNHFVSAAIFGGVAVASAVAGRVIAGDSFKQQTSTATNGSSAQHQASGKGGSVYSSLGDQTIEGGNTAGSNRRIPVDVSLHLKLDKNGVLDVVKDSFRTNGPMRTMILNAG